MRFIKSIGVLVLAAGYSLIAVAALAQTNTSTPAPNSMKSVPDAFIDAFFNESGTVYRNSSIRRQFEAIFGSGTLVRNSFPDNQAGRDAQRIDDLYRYTLRQQTSSGPIIRTMDLKSPFDSSLGTTAPLPTTTP